MKMKKILMSMIIVCLIATLSFQGMGADAATTTISSKGQSTNVILNGSKESKKIMSATVNKTVYLSLDDAAYLLNMNYKWDEKKKVVKFTTTKKKITKKKNVLKSNEKIKGKKSATKLMLSTKTIALKTNSGKTLTPFVYKNKLYIPLQPVANSVGSGMLWDTKKLQLSMVTQAGVKGDKGDAGDKGDVGEKGDTGLTGDKGDTGATGATGATGGAGAKGEKGDAGATGATGATGDKGDKGDAGATGATGATGAKGDTGERGAIGPIGATGATVLGKYVSASGVYNYEDKTNGITNFNLPLTLDGSSSENDFKVSNGELTIVQPGVYYVSYELFYPGYNIATPQFLVNGVNSPNFSVKNAYETEFYTKSGVLLISAYNTKIKMNLENYTYAYADVLGEIRYNLTIFKLQ